MTQLKPCMEASRAMVLAAHSAAGLVTSMRKSSGTNAAQYDEVSRLLRSAEALARSAVAIITYMVPSRPPSPERIAGGGKVPEPTGAKPKPRHRRAKKKVVQAEVEP